MPGILLLADAERERNEIEALLAPLERPIFSSDFDPVTFLPLLKDRPAPIAALLLITGGAPSLKTIMPALRRLMPDTPLLVATDDSALAMQATANGAQDVLTLPLSPAKVRNALRSIMHSHQPAPEKTMTPPRDFSEFVLRDDSMRQVIERAKVLAGTARPIFLFGEPGVGKTMLARAMHAAAGKDTALLRLLGNRPSAELCHLFAQAVPRSTVVIDLPAEGSEELDRRSVERLLLAIKDQELRVIVCQRTSRHDTAKTVPPSPLRSALEAETLFIPALRHRSDDILAQSEYFLLQTARLLKRPVLQPTPQAARLLLEHDWPGNTRELIDTLLQAYLRADGTRLTASSLEPIVKPEEPRSGLPVAGELAIRPFNARGELRRLDDIEAEYMRLAFLHCMGSRSQIARQLGIGRTTLYRKARQLDLM